MTVFLWGCAGVVLLLVVMAVWACPPATQSDDFRAALRDEDDAA